MADTISPSVTFRVPHGSLTLVKVSDVDSVWNHASSRGNNERYTKRQAAWLLPTSLSGRTPKL